MKRLLALLAALTVLLALAGCGASEDTGDSQKLSLIHIYIGKSTVMPMPPSGALTAIDAAPGSAWSGSGTVRR